MINTRNTAITVPNTNLKYIICPICSAEIVRNQAGFHSHISTHVKDGSITNEAKVAILKDVFFKGRIGKNKKYLAEKFDVKSS